MARRAKMEDYQQSRIFSERDNKIAYCRGNHHYAVWENDLKTKKKNTITVSNLLNGYFNFCDINFAAPHVRKSKSVRFLVTSEILERLQQNNVRDDGLDEHFARKYEEKHGLGPDCDAADVAEVIRMASNCFQSFRSFYECDPNFAENFIKSEYSIWADIQLKLNENLKCLCGTIDAIYWIDKSKNHVGIIDWNTSEHSEHSEDEHEGSQWRKCRSHLHASILETKYGLTVTANIVNLKGSGFDVNPVKAWKDCKKECVKLFKFC